MTTTAEEVRHFIDDNQWYMGRRLGGPVSREDAAADWATRYSLRDVGIDPNFVSNFLYQVCPLCGWLYETVVTTGGPKGVTVTESERIDRVGEFLTGGRKGDEYMGVGRRICDDCDTQATSNHLKHYPTEIQS